jgi:aspartyl-tRNA(Asn)/glutamyl-tRNA(Gln) amidotransferase subunit C
VNKISKKEVEKVALLARLKLSEEETAEMQKDMSGILGFIDQINELNTEGILPTAHVLDIKNVFREDDVEASYDRDIFLKLAPKTSDGFIVVPKVVG